MISKFSDIKNIDVSDTYLKDYVSIKEQNPEAIILFQIGKFYEAFFEDAETISGITGITVSSRLAKNVGDIIQAGIPKESLNIYIKKLLNENLKICLCDEMRDDNNNIFRKATRTYTIGTIIENEFLDFTENNYILAIDFYNDVFKISYADISDGQFYKTFGSKAQMLNEIDKISPKEILLNNSHLKSFKNLSSKYNVTILDEKYFKNSIENAIIDYCKNIYKNFVPKLDKLIEYFPDSYLLMDDLTRRNLELTRTSRYLKKKGSLFWFLNTTKTPMGTRLLKKYLNEPLLDIDLISLRLDTIEELIIHQNLLVEFEKNLEQFTDLSRICAKISNFSIYPNDLFRIANNSNALINLYNLCDKFNSEILTLNKSYYNDVIEITDVIKNAINKNAPCELKSGGIIAQGYNPNLDYLKSKLNIVLNSIQNYEAKLRNKLKIDKLKIVYSKSIDFYIEIPNTKQNSVPNDFFKKQVLSNCARYSTEELKNLESDYFSLNYKINEMEYEIFCQIRSMVANYIDSIRKLSKEIAQIDVIVSFARCALDNNLSKPEFENNGIRIKNGFHPSLIKLKNEIIKNDTELDNSNMIILTGANMSGKSTYLKYNALICLLFQIGCYVPAEFAQLPIIDKIFLRQGANDDIVNNNSSFMVEMNEMKFILDNATEFSLILFDEPAKSTNADEGGAIARAYCEYLLNNIGAKSIIATHNIQLTKLEENYPNKVYNYVIGNSDVAEFEINNRKVRRGTIKTSFALNTAVLAQLPDEIIKQAESYMKE